MGEVPEIHNPTLAWVQSLPSPNNGEPFINEEFGRPSSRFLETPRPNLDFLEPSFAKSKEKIEESLNKMKNANAQKTPAEIGSNSKNLNPPAEIAAVYQRGK